MQSSVEQPPFFFGGGAFGWFAATA